MAEKNSYELWRDLCSNYYKATLQSGANITQIRDHVVITWFDTNTGDDINIDSYRNISASASRLVFDIRNASKDDLTFYIALKAEARNEAHKLASRERKVTTLNLTSKVMASTRVGMEMQSLIEYCRCVKRIFLYSALHGGFLHGLER